MRRKGSNREGNGRRKDERKGMDKEKKENLVERSRCAGRKE